ncbi:hypothetical protein FA95DRAFT_1560497 [Auriscalpium vulgare]|uniref:Uncharacterized protein n=1 Tax=Auriscalpium vulgare TaxID=40419 RepID=A0ACB8RPG9_9AGAM|nr:hypothetical protein FA95DRAFT_1560497 [Auriscalpium vulgare]
MQTYADQESFPQPVHPAPPHASNSPAITALKFRDLCSIASKQEQMPSPHWCSQRQVDQIVDEYMWFWGALLTSVLAYVPLYLWRRRKASRDRATGDLREERGRVRVPRIAYPAVYALLVLPLSVARFRASTRSPKCRQYNCRFHGIT